MKKLILLALMGFAQIAWAQNATSYGNFKLVDQEIIYQHVFEQDSITPAKLEAFYKKLPYVSNITTKPQSLYLCMLHWTCTSPIPLQIPIRCCGLGIKRGF